MLQMIGFIALVWGITSLCNKVERKNEVDTDQEERVGRFERDLYDYPTDY